MMRRLLWLAFCCLVVGIVDYMVSPQNRKWDFQPNYLSAIGQRYSGNTTVDQNQNYTAYTVKANETFSAEVHSSGVDRSMKFKYSNKAIIQCALAIHNATRKYVDVGSDLCVQRLPQCIIIGNFKCGTRELIDFMAMHPRIKILYEPMYELEFFINFYSRGLEWYRLAMPCSYQKQITVLKAPSYFQSKLVPSRIHKMNSSIKLIAMFREPLLRTLSHFTFNNYGARYKYDLRAAVTNHKNGNNITEKSTFIQHSIYDEGLARYLKYFDRSQIKIISTTDFQRDPYKVLFEVEEFLNLEHTILRDNFVFNKEKGYHCLRKDNLSKTAACYQSDRGRNVSDSSKKIKTSPELIAKLKAFFKPHNENFFRLAGRKFDW